MEIIEFQEIFSKIVVKAWQDPEWKQQLLKDPEGTLREQGIEFPKGTSLHVYENTDKDFYLVLPQKPDGALTDSELEAVAAGMCLHDYEKRGMMLQLDTETHRMANTTGSSCRR